MLHYKNNSVRFLPLLDTGADYSIFYKADAVRLGIDLSKGKESSLANADSSFFRAKQFQLKIGIEDISFQANICFVENILSAMPLLGRLDIYEKFLIEISEKRKYVQLRIEN